MYRFFITLLLILTPSIALADFSDVATTHKNVDAIEYLQGQDIIGGYPDGSFRPNSAINRAEMMKILVEGQGVTPSVSEYSNCFPDVGVEWFAPYVCYAKAQDWVGGYPDGTFKPANNVLDIEAMKMTINAKGIEVDANYTPLIFNTVPPNEWYRPFLVTAEKFKLTEGFQPGSNFTRAEVSEVIFRTLVIERTNATVYSQSAKNELLFESYNEPDASYGPATYETYTPSKRDEYHGVKPYVLFFHAKWCSICKKIEADLKANLSTYSDGIVILEVDYDSEVALRNEFGVTRQYWFVMFNKEGEKVFSNNLFHADEVVEEAKKTL